MAEVNEQQQIIAAQPMQHKVVVINYETITLKGADIYGKMKPFSQTAREYNSDRMAGETYYLYRFMGTIITVPAKFHNAYEAFDVLEVTLTGSNNPRKVANPNVAGGEMMVDSQAYGLDGYLTTADEIAMLKLAKHRSTMQRAQKTIQKIDVTKELTDAELQALIEEA